MTQHKRAAENYFQIMTVYTLTEQRKTTIIKVHLVWAMNNQAITLGSHDIFKIIKRPNPFVNKKNGNVYAELNSICIEKTLQLVVKGGVRQKQKAGL